MPMIVFFYPSFEVSYDSISDWFFKFYRTANIFFKINFTLIYLFTTFHVMKEISYIICQMHTYINYY